MIDTGRHSMVKYSALCSAGSDIIGDRPLMDTITIRDKLQDASAEDAGESKNVTVKIADPETKNTCNECCAMIYKSDGTAQLRRTGVEDFCGNGCLMVGDIRVPFPDCKTHAIQFTRKQNCGTMVV